MCVLVCVCAHCVCMCVYVCVFKACVCVSVFSVRCVCCNISHLLYFVSSLTHTHTHTQMAKIAITRALADASLPYDVIEQVCMYVYDVWMYDV